MILDVQLLTNVKKNSKKQGTIYRPVNRAPVGEPALRQHGLSGFLWQGRHVNKQLIALCIG